MALSICFHRLHLAQFFFWKSLFRNVGVFSDAWSCPFQVDQPHLFLILSESLEPKLIAHPYLLLSGQCIATLRAKISTKTAGNKASSSLSPPGSGSGLCYMSNVTTLRYTLRTLVMGRRTGTDQKSEACFLNFPRKRLGSILLEEATVELDDIQGLLSITTKTKHKFTFRGRNLREMVLNTVLLHFVISSIAHVENSFRRSDSCNSECKRFVCTVQEA